MGKVKRLRENKRQQKVSAHLKTDSKAAETLADLECSFMLITIMDKHKHPIYGPKA